MPHKTPKPINVEGETNSRIFTFPPSKAVAKGVGTRLQRAPFFQSWNITSSYFVCAEQMEVRSCNADCVYSVEWVSSLFIRSLGIGEENDMKRGERMDGKGGAQGKARNGDICTMKHTNITYT